MSSKEELYKVLLENSPYGTLFLRTAFVSIVTPRLEKFSVVTSAHFKGFPWRKPD